VLALAEDSGNTRRRIESRMGQEFGGEQRALVAWRSFAFCFFYFSAVLGGVDCSYKLIPSMTLTHAQRIIHNFHDVIGFGLGQLITHWPPLTHELGFCTLEPIHGPVFSCTRRCADIPLTSRLTLLTRNDPTLKPESPVHQARIALDSNQAVPVNLTYKLTKKIANSQIQECIG